MYQPRRTLSQMRINAFNAEKVDLLKQIKRPLGVAAAPHSTLPP